MPKRTLNGVVVSDKQDKTVVVRVERRYTHPMLKKTVRRSKKYYAHDEKNEFSVGDTVWIDVVGDEDPVEALAPDGADPALRVPVGLRHPRRDLHDLHAGGGEHRIERGREFAGAAFASLRRHAESGTIRDRFRNRES